jgi:phage-related protein
MDIPVNKWEIDKKYQINDIVEMGNLSIADSGGARDASGGLVTPLAADSDKEITREDEFVIAIETPEEAVITSNSEIRVGSLFSVNPNIGYSLRTMVRKGSESSATSDPYTTFIKQEESSTEPGLYIIDPNASIGVGAGIKFFDSTGSEVGVTDLRNTHRLMASSELSREEYYNVQLDIAPSSIPSTAARASLVVFVYGIKAGSFVFKQVSTTNLNRFFYCTKDNTSSVSNDPNEAVGAQYWTQDFVWRPAYNSKADFVAINEKLQLGEGSDYVTNLAINSLPMQLNLQFDNRTDKEARAIIHFLEEKFFPYESVFALDYKGNRLLSSDVGHFSFKYTYPYREDLKFTCTKFNQTKTYRNNNNISATFVCNTESTLRSLAGHAGYNDRTDALIPLAVESSMDLKKGQRYTLNTFSLSEDAVENISLTAMSITRYPRDLELPIEGGLITFSTATDVVVGDCLNIRVSQPESSRFNVGLTRVTKKISSHEIVFAPILDQGSVSNLEATLIPIGIEDGSLFRTDIFQQDPVDGGADYTALYESLDLTELGAKGWYESSWFFKTDQADISGTSWHLTPGSKWAYTTALGGQWIYLEPDGLNQLWFWQASIGWTWCTSGTFAGNRAITYNAVADSAIGAVGWVEWYNPKPLECGTCEAKVYNYTDERWYNVDLGVPQQIVAPGGEDPPVEPPLPTPDIEFVTALAVSGPDTVPPQTFKIEKLDRCFSDCLSNKVLLPDQVSIVKAAPVDPETGERKGSQIYLKNYRKIQIDSDITGDTGTVTFTALENFTIDKGFQVLISTVQGGSSIYLKDADEFIKYPWLEVRNFDHKPSIAFSLAQSPAHIQSSFVQYYNHAFKKGINQNLSTFNLVFDKRADEEAAEILQFLEAHLGCKKFRFQMPRPYTKDGDYLTTESRPYMSTFYCPSWGHDVVFKNNHTITATFVESVTSKEEDLRSVFGIGDRKEEEPCFGAEIYDPITNHSLCTFSSVLEAALGAGIGSDGCVEIKRKEVDLVFLVDGSPSARSTMGVGGFTKFQAIIDMVLKTINAYDGFNVPGTNPYGGAFLTPEITWVDASGNSNVLPWPLDDQGTSLIKTIGTSLANPASEVNLNDNLVSNGYNLSNLNRFKIKIGQTTVNLGLVYFDLFGKNVLDLSEIPDAYDTPSMKGLVEAANTYPVLTQSNALSGIGVALAQMYNSSRAATVDSRIIIMLGNGKFNASSDFLDVAEAIRKGGDLSKRRPSTLTLANYGIGVEMALYAQRSGGGDGRLRNPDLSDNPNADPNPAWYEQEVPTMLTFASIGDPGIGIAAIGKQSVYDYSALRDPQFYFPITDGGASWGEVNRLIEVVDVVEILTEDTGYQNLFTVTIHNCGPHDVELLNTIVSAEQQGAVKYTTEFLTAGIPKGGSIANIEYVSAPDDYKIGNGGQFTGDTKNKKLLQKADSASNILWESFNTKYEVYRAGAVSNIGGGWSANSTLSEGVNNAGVASKGMPIRVFKNDSGLEVIDYNIGGAVDGNNYIGNYSHLPKLKPGEQIDLFFGLRSTQALSSTPKFQLFFNSKDNTMKYMDCWANLNICTSKKTFTPKRTLSGGITFDGDFILFTYNFTDGRDLDTRTQIRLTTGEGLPHGGNAGNMMGWGRSYADLNGLLKWGGDNLGTGFEAVLVNLRGIRAAYPKMVDIQVGLAAFWYGSRGAQPVSIKATLWKGGTPVHGGYSWTNPTATETVWVRSGRKAIQSHRRDRGNNGQQIATFTFNFPTYNGRFECWGGNCLDINNGD